MLRINELDDVFHMTEVLAHQPRPSGPRLSIVTNAGGPGVLATDMLIGLGEQMATLSDATVAALNKVLPPHWSHNNPIDIIGDAGPERYEAAVKIAAQDPNADGLLVIMTPQAMSDPVEIAQKLVPFAKLPGKPILASWMGGDRAAEGEAILNKAGIPTFSFPDNAVRAFHYLWRYSYNLNALYETPTLAESDKNAALQAKALISEAQKQGRTLLTEFESKQLLHGYSIPTVPTRLANSAERSRASWQRRLVFRLYLKLNSLTLTHKTDVGGVKLNLRDADAVQRAFAEIAASVAEKAGAQHFQGVTVQPMVQMDGSYELIVGSSIDAQFGPVLLFGLGGQLVEVFKDRALALPPLEHDPGAPLYGADADLQGTAGRARQEASRSQPPGAACWCVSVNWFWICRWCKRLTSTRCLSRLRDLLALDARVVLFPEITDLATYSEAHHSRLSFELCRNSDAERRHLANYSAHPS